MRKTLLVDGSAVVQRNLAKPHMVWDGTKTDGFGFLCKLNPNKIICLTTRIDFSFIFYTYKYECSKESSKLQRSILNASIDLTWQIRLSVHQNCSTAAGARGFHLASYLSSAFSSVV